jgi:hypothetical protein
MTNGTNGNEPMRVPGAAFGAFVLGLAPQLNSTLGKKKCPEAEPLLRDCLAIRARRISSSVTDRLRQVASAFYERRLLTRVAR